MKSLLGLSMYVLFLAAAISAPVLMLGVLLAQTDPFIGTWKMNTAKSKYSPGPAPQSMTWTYESQGNGVIGSAEVTAADGSRFAYRVTASYDGKDYPVSGTGVPSGADTVALKRINPNTIEASWKKAGKIVQTARNVVSKDGKVFTNMSEGTNANGQPTSNVTVWDKQ